MARTVVDILGKGFKYEQEIDMSSYKGHTVDFRFVKLRTILNNCMTFITFDKNLSRD